MIDTSFVVPASQLDRLAGLYGNEETLRLLVEVGAEPNGTKQLEKGQGQGKLGLLMRIDGQEPSQSAWADGGSRTTKFSCGGGFVGHNSGGCVSTVQDMALFCRFLFRRGVVPASKAARKATTGRRLLRKETVDMMFENWLPPVLNLEQASAPQSLREMTLKAAEALPRSDEVGWCIIGQMFANRYSGGPRGRLTLDCGQGGAAGTNWCVNVEEDLAIIWFAQCVDDFQWEQLHDSKMSDLWVAVQEAHYRGLRLQRKVLPPPVTPKKRPRSTTPQKEVTKALNGTPDAPRSPSARRRRISYSPGP